MQRTIQNQAVAGRGWMLQGAWSDVTSTRTDCRISVNSGCGSESDELGFLVLADGKSLCEPCGGFDEVEEAEVTRESPVLLKFGASQEYTLRLASTEEDRLRCWHLVYREYLALGYATAQELPYRYSIHDALPEAMTLLVEKDGVAIGTVTGFPDSALGLPADAIYRDELDAMRRAGRRVMEVGRFTIDHAHQNQRQVLTSLMDILTIYARRVWGATDFVITVNPSHVKYYERMLLFKKQGELKSLDSVQGAPAVLLALDLALEERIRRYAHGEGPKPEEYDGGRMLHQHSSNQEQEEAHAARLRQVCRRPEATFLRRYFVWVKPLIAALPQEARQLFEGWYPGLMDDRLVREVGAA